MAKFFSPGYVNTHTYQNINHNCHISNRMYYYLCIGHQTPSLRFSQLHADALESVSVILLYYIKLIFSMHNTFQTGYLWYIIKSCTCSSHQLSCRALIFFTTVNILGNYKTEQLHWTHFRYDSEEQLLSGYVKKCLYVVIKLSHHTMQKSTAFYVQPLKCRL